MRLRRVLPLLLLLGVATCAQEDMFDQQRLTTWGATRDLPDRMAMQAPVAGTVARQQAATPAQPARITEALLLRGQQQYRIDCVPCHGESGDGEGMIVQRGFPHPPPLFNDDLRHAKAEHFYDVITHGHGVMYSYADRVSPADRWAIVAYIRALQQSQHARVAELSDQDRRHLPGATP
jgi:mono/diheme cytochrome c family protein